MEVQDLLDPWKNELDQYISKEVPEIEGDEAKAIRKKKLGKAQEDHCRFY